MKKSLIIAILAAGTFSGKVKAQDENNTIKINPLSAVFRVGSVFYEHKLNDKAALQLGVAYFGTKISDIKFSGLALTPEYRIYPKGNALNGLYIGPYLRYQNFTVTDGDDKGSYSSFGGGVLLGRQWVFKSGFALDLFLGPAYNSGKFKADDGSNEPELSAGIDGFGIRTGITLGFGF